MVEVLDDDVGCDVEVGWGVSGAAGPFREDNGEVLRQRVNRG